MKNLLLICCVLLCVAGDISGQIDTTLYFRKLKTIKALDNSAYKYQLDSLNKFEINGKFVDFYGFLDHHGIETGDFKCEPCYLKTYNYNLHLLKEGVYHDKYGWIGYYKEYHENGKLKAAGRFKDLTRQNKLKTYFDTYEKDVPICQWNHYDKEGKFQYSEFWEDGKFLMQVPEQQQPEIWKAKLRLNGEEVTAKYLSSNHIKKLVLEIGFKNTNKDSTGIELSFVIRTMLGKTISQTMAYEELKRFDLDQLLSNHQLSYKDCSTFEMMVNYKQVNIANYNLNIHPNVDGTAINIDSIIHTNENREIYLVNSLFPQRKVFINPYSYCYLKYSSDVLDDKIQKQETTLYGNLLNATKNTVHISFNHEEIELINKQGFSSIIENRFWCDSCTDKEQLRQIELNKILSVEYQSPRKETFATIGMVVTLASAVSAFLVAPLASINYGGGNFNGDRFATIAGLSSIGVAVGLPILYFSRFKTYKISNDPSVKKRDMWFIQN